MPDRMNPKRGAPFVVEHPRLARMSDKPPRPRRIDGKIIHMPDKPREDTGKRDRMAPFVKTSAGRAPSVCTDQEGGKPVAEKPAAKEPQGYVRLRLRVEDGEMSVVGAKAVEGPLVEGKLQGDLAYEVTLGSKRLAVGAVPDVGVRRSFPNLEGPPEQQVHHVTQLRSYEIAVRVPKERVSLASLPRLEIALYRVKEDVPTERMAAGAIGEQFTRELREVGRMKGIRAERLDEPVARELREALK